MDKQELVRPLAALDVLHDYVRLSIERGDSLTARFWARLLVTETLLLSQAVSHG
jgi:hypothetical protein